MRVDNHQLKMFLGRLDGSTSLTRCDPVDRLHRSASTRGRCQHRQAGTARANEELADPASICATACLALNQLARLRRSAVLLACLMCATAVVTSAQADACARPAALRYWLPPVPRSARSSNVSAAARFSARRGPIATTDRVPT
jgi:hypothetical protein